MRDGNPYAYGNTGSHPHAGAHRNSYGHIRSICNAYSSTERNRHHDRCSYQHAGAHAYQHAHCNRNARA